MAKKPRRPTSKPRLRAAAPVAPRKRTVRAPVPALTHLDSTGAARMVDVSAKEPTVRVAVATALVHVGPQVLAAITRGQLPKGDVFAVARIAGIAAAKKTAELIPLCHPLALQSVEVQIAPRAPGRVLITATARITGKTGVEMEALTAASVAALALYDMCKSASKSIRIGPIQLESKTGGKSGPYRRTPRHDNR